MRAFLISLFLTISQILTAQQLRVFTRISSAEGLSENSVRSVTQLPDGRMAIVNEGMLNLFNGTSFQYIHFNEQNSYPLTAYRGFHHVYIDINERLWIKNQGKLMVLNIKQERYGNRPAEIIETLGVHEPLADFFMDTDKNYWLVTVSGKLLYRNAATRKTVTFLTRAVPDDADPVYDIATLNGNLFLFYKSGLMVVYDLTGRREVYRENTLDGQTPGAYNNTLYVVPGNHTLYMLRNGTRGIMLAFNPLLRKWQKVIETPYSLNCIATGFDGEIVITTRDGLWSINKNLEHARFIPSLRLVNGSVISTEISCLSFDTQGGLWLGTLNKGLLYYHPDRFRFSNVGKSLFPVKDEREIQVKCFTEDSNRNLLVGTDHGIFYFHGEQAQLSPIMSAFNGVNCNALMTTDNGDIYVALSDGFSIIKGDRVKHYAIGQVNHMLDGKDGRIYLATSARGLLELDPVTGKIQPLPVNPADGGKVRHVRQVIRYHGILFGIANGGLFTFDSAKGLLCAADRNSYDWISGQNNQHFNCVMEDSRGLLWFATQDGLNVWDEKNKKIRSFHSEDGLVNNVIKSVIEDRQHAIWVTTSNGVSRIDISNKWPERQYHFVNFNHFDGVLDNEFVRRSIFIMRDGTLLAGGIDGFNELDLKRIFTAGKSPKPIFVALEIFGKQVRPGERYHENVMLHNSVTSASSITLRFDQNFITLAFSALNYINPSHSYYRYFMEGIDNEWHEEFSSGGIGRATYTNLAPGVYKLKVRATGDRSHWNKEVASIIITILPPWWKTTPMTILYILVGLVSGYWLVTTYIERNRAKHAKIQQEKLDQMKFSFFTNMSHELKTPLTLIMGPLEVLLKKCEDSELSIQLSGIYRNAQALLHLVNQLLNFRRIESDRESLHLTNCDMHEFVHSLCGPFRDLAKSRGIAFRVYCPKGQWLHLDKEKFAMILNNLLSNAFKFTKENGEVTVKAETSSMPGSGENAVRFTVSDTGVGMQSVDLPKIFNRFFRAGNQDITNTGSGIGLYLVNEYVRLHNGSISVQSDVGKGSTFTIYFPADRKPPENDAIAIVQTREKDKNKVRILVTEDNPEFREFISSQLEQHYEVIQAVNGKDGLEKVYELSPDLVISDIMMPEMNGIDFCDTIKKDIRTSHIPIILLTARSSEESQVEGYMARADAYITKPFNIELLSILVRNLLEKHEERKKLFKKAIVIQPSLVTASDIDEKLVKKALEAIEKNLDNMNYSVEELSSDMNMERSGLYRKLVAIIGQTPSVFIRSVRLKRAAQLLSRRELPVAEIADRVGFNNPAYFSKCFQEEFGVKPSQYADQTAQELASQH